MGRQPHPPLRVGQALLDARYETGHDEQNHPNALSTHAGEHAKRASRSVRRRVSAISKHERRPRLAVPTPLRHPRACPGGLMGQRPQTPEPTQRAPVDARYEPGHDAFLFRHHRPCAGDPIGLLRQTGLDRPSGCPDRVGVSRKQQSQRPPMRRRTPGTSRRVSASREQLPEGHKENAGNFTPRNRAPP